MIGAIAPEDVLIHHFSIGSRASRIAYALPGRMALIYHNITPPEYFLGVHNDLVKLCFRGRRELTAYIDRCDLALGDSEYNRQELEALGFPATGVLPVVPDFSHLELGTDRSLAAGFDDEWTNVMFVGRVIPNKKFEDVIRAFHVYRTRHNPRSRLLLVGSYSGFETYLTLLTSLVANLGTPDVHFLGHVSNEQLSALYDVADLFLCASEHEGFCVPIIEAFHKRVPVLAYAATAVPATMDGAGVLYQRKDFAEIARLMDAVLSDAALEDAIVASQDAALAAPAGPRFLRHAAAFRRSAAAEPAPPGARRGLRLLGAVRAIRAPRRAASVPAVAVSRAPGERRALMVINQWVPAAHRGDAIGDSARRVRDLLRAAGHQSDLYALTIDDDLREDVRPFSDDAARRGDITIFHFALPSPMTEAFAQSARRPRAAVSQHHAGGVLRPLRRAAVPAGGARTPGAALARRAGRPRARRFGVQPPELEELGFARTGVMPIAVDIERLTGAPRRPALEKILADGHINILFVGRIVPNKRIEDHIRLAEFYKRYVDSYYRFIFVGRYDGVPRYFSMIQALIVQYQMLPERFVFTGGVPNEDLAAYYRWADAYVSLSEHEGFCVPLVESMAMDVPVLAYAAGAVPETLGGAGVLFSPKDLEFAAEMLGTLVYDRAMRDQVIAGQRRRLRDFSPARIDGRLKEVLASLGA